MKTIDGYNVKIFTDNVQESAVEQIRQLMSIDVFSNCRVRVMPDVHSGAGCVIGFTGDLGDKVIPNIVGVDIGCGISVQPFRCAADMDFHAFNEYILKNVPSGNNHRTDEYASLDAQYKGYYKEAKDIIRQLRCYRELKDVNHLDKSIGTLGGGNHFIELDKDEQGMCYLVVHTGSRNLGKQVAEIYQKQACKCRFGSIAMMKEQNRIVSDYKRMGRESELKEVLQSFRKEFMARKPVIPAELAYLDGSEREDYLHDMRLCQRWAALNRKLIVDVLLDFLAKEGCVESGGDYFESVHNYIGDDNIIRKGAISARLGEKCIIPMNMRDGALICIGKGNEDWNYSAPHGAGRIMSRSQAIQLINMDDFQQSMNGIYSETVTEATKDESPMAYKRMDEIIVNIVDTVDLVNIIKPIFNYKEAE